ncbi:MAG: hypothetical protein VX679_06045 [Pseudomonadota bacterium]|nr:hypothetical protein [Pseudomonadota bacterium]
MGAQRLYSINQGVANSLWYRFVSVLWVSMIFIGLFGIPNPSLHVVLAVLVTGEASCGSHQKRIVVGE